MYKEKLDKILLKVQKPSRYIGGELNSVQKNPEDVKMFIWDGVAGMKPFTAPITYKK